MSRISDKLPFELLPIEFYVGEMLRAVHYYETKNLHEVAPPIFSFFHGKRTEERAVPVNTGHVYIFVEDAMLPVLIEYPDLFIRWVEVLYGYFLHMAATPALARDIWRTLWLVLNFLEKAGNKTLRPRLQMGGWAASYDPELRDIALAHVKGMDLHDEFEVTHRSLGLSTKFNEGNDDYLLHIHRAYENSHHLTPTGKLQAHIHYFNKISADDTVLAKIMSILDDPDLREYRLGKMSLLASLFWTLIQKKNYNALLKFCRFLKGDISSGGLHMAHAFILPNAGANFPALTNSSELVTFNDRDNGDSYFRLIRISNAATQTAISLLGEEQVDFKGWEDDDMGTPSRNFDFRNLKAAVVEHYRLNDAFYREIGLLTILPSHNHPIQACMLLEGVKPPMISISLRCAADESVRDSAIFFLSSETLTHDIEREWILNVYGAASEIYTDPDPQLFLHKMSQPEYSLIYISAHGRFSHQQAHEEAIHFSDVSTISLSELKELPGSHFSRTIILNICDGATSLLSYNHNNSGLASALTKGNEILVSHIWPVKPLYAGTFGLLLLCELRSHLTMDALLHVYSVLNQENNAISQALKNLGTHFERLAESILTVSYEFNDFRNLGSVAVYV